MSFHPVPLSRATSRFLAAALCVSGMLLAALPAAAATEWLLRYTTGYGFAPDPPVATGPTTFLLYGYFPTGCGEVVSSEVTDSAHVALRVRSDASCPGSAPVDWSESFPLGTLSRGLHDLTITLTFERGDSVLVESATFAYGIEDSTTPPPPPPPPPPPATPPLVIGWTTDPSPASSALPMRLTVSGFAPFGCPLASGAAVSDTAEMSITLTAQEACLDTTRAWAGTFDFGILRAGWHTYDLAIALVDGDSTATAHVPVSFLVLDPAGGGVPPPPEDSLVVVMSPSRPNPFGAQSRFTVSLENGTRANVAVFDVNGRRVRTVFAGLFERGTTQLSWDGRRDDGSRAPAGLYFYRLVLPNRVVARRVVLLPQP